MNRKIYRKTAKKHGVSVKEVKREMQMAVDTAYENPNYHACSIYAQGEKPTVDEVVDHLARRAKARIKP